MKGQIAFDPDGRPYVAIGSEVGGHVVEEITWRPGFEIQVKLK